MTVISLKKCISMFFLLTAICQVSASGAVIRSKDMAVTVSDNFPQVVKYQWLDNGAAINGQDEDLAKVLINGSGYQPAVQSSAKGDTVHYTMDIEPISVKILAELSVEGPVLKFEVTDIQENGDTLVKTFEIPDHNLITGRSSQKNVKLAVNNLAGGESFLELSSAQIAAKPSTATYAILTTDDLAASIENNTIVTWHRYKYQTTGSGNDKQFAIWNNKWIWREIDTETVELPWCKVIITRDRNGDDLIGWQDGAIAYRDIQQDRFGAETIQSSISHVAMNFASVGQNPFLRILDNVKKLSHYIDGFGQTVLLKGYASEGHDSGHPDYGNINEKAGGAEDMQFLCEKAKEYNAMIGVHINHTEAYPEARAFSEELVTDQPGWRWLDQSWKIDRKADTLSGNLYDRLVELKGKIPDLSYVYVDVYFGIDWVAHKLGSKLNELGWPIWTEYPNYLGTYSIWSHHKTSPRSIYRFIHNSDKDVFGYDPVLMGYDHTGFMGWDSGGYEKNIHEVVELFYTKNLPTKYMQNFELLKLSDTEAVFSGGLISKREGQSTNIYKDGRLIFSNDRVFIPWDPVGESKIYHWNGSGGASSWILPASWSGLKNVKLYKLTDLGRVFVDEIAVDDGSIVINAKAETPYVVYKKSAPAQKVEWSEGSVVKDMGFDSHGFDYWNVSSPAADNDHVTISNDENGQTYLHIEGNTGAAAKVRQKIVGLEGGKTYTASVWTQVTGGRTAGIRVSDFGGSVVEKVIDRTEFPCNFPNASKNGTNFQRLKVLFDVPKGNDGAVISLIAEAGEQSSAAMFDDVRVVQIEKADQNGHYFFEDFENVDEGWGPFVYGYNRPCNTHLSETHEPYTDDTIDGRFSLKTMDERHVGYVVRTLPSTLKLEPQSWYTVSFDYIADNADQYKFVVDEPYVDDAEFDATYEPKLAAENWAGAEEGAGAEADNGRLVVKSSVFDLETPEVVDGELTFKVESQRNGRCGAFVRYKNADSWVFIGYDTGSKWVWATPNTYGTLTNAGPSIDGDGKEHEVRIRYVGQYFKLWVDGEAVFEGELKAVPVQAGKIGFRSWFNSVARYSDVNLKYSQEAAESQVGARIAERMIPSGEGKMQISFKTDESEYSFIAFEKLNNSRGKLVIDNFTVDQGRK
ncbi:endo-alpha-N-acetylgalactosaminidase family protein [Anaerohalosphaera lusitana]|nr:endo-alpha-N-acetylgalactosaminidase family protein [Anaerohalosphaera lusitana]